MLAIQGSWVVSLAAQRLFPVKEKEKWGLIDATGRLKVSPVYDLISVPDQYGFLLTQIDDRLGLIDPTGDLLLPNRYLDIQVLDPQIFTVLEGENWRVINRQEQTILPGKYLQLDPLGDGLLAYRNVAGWGVVNQAGHPVIPPGFAGVDRPNANFLRVRTTNGSGLYNNAGREILPAVADSISFLTDDLILYRRGGYWGGVTPTGQAVFPPQYERLEELGNDDLLLIGPRGSVVYGATCQKTFSLPAGTTVLPFSENYLALRGGSSVGLVNRCGTVVLRPIYDEVQPFSQELFRVSLNRHWGLRAAGDRSVLPESYDYLSPLNGRVAGVKSGDRYGVVNFLGELLVPPRHGRLQLEGDKVLAYTGPDNGSDLITYHVDANGRLNGGGSSNQHFRVRVTGAGQTTPKSQPLYLDQSRRVMAAFEWFYAADQNRWGLRNRLDGNVSIPPTFSRVEVLDDLGITLVGLPAAAELTFERTTFRTNMTFGILINESGILVSEMDLIDLRVEDWRRGNAVARCLFTNGRFGLIDRLGRIRRRDLAYVGAFSEGIAAISPTGELSGTLGPESGIMPLRAFTRNLKTGVTLLDHTTYDRGFAKNARLTCSDCRFGYVDSAGEQIIPPTFLRAGTFSQDRAIVVTERGAGLIDRTGRLVIPPGPRTLERLGDAYRISVDRNLTGLVDTNGRLRLPAGYLEVRRPTEGFMAARKGQYWGFLSEAGTEAIPFDYLDVRPFSESRATVLTNNGWTSVEPQAQLSGIGYFAELGGYHNGLAWAKADNGLYGYINRNGDFIIEPQLEAVTDFNEGVARVRLGGKYGLLNPAGEWVVRPKFSQIQPFQPAGIAVARLASGQDRYVMIDRQGEILTSQTYREIHPLREGRALVRGNGGYGYLDAGGREVIDPVWAQAADFSGGRAVVQRGGRCGYLDPDGTLVIPCRYSRCLDFDAERAVVYQNMRNAGIIDPQGNELIAPSLERMLHFREGRGLVEDRQLGYYFITDKAALYDGFYDEARPFFNGVAAIRRGQRWGLVNRRGMCLLRPRFASISEFEAGVATVTIDRHYGLADASGKIIVPPRYPYLEAVSERLIRVERANEVGYVSTEGRWIWALAR